MPSPPERKRILAVNDTEEILELFRDIIEGIGHEFVALTYAPDDLAQVQSIRPDLVIVDFVLGGREFLGWQLVQKMRMSPPTAAIPIIICTAAKREVQEQEGWLAEKGITTVLKPFEVIDLERGIERALTGPPRGAQRRAASGYDREAGTRRGSSSDDE
jgi:CheY-like chemotaxis protein